MNIVQQETAFNEEDQKFLNELMLAKNNSDPTLESVVECFVEYLEEEIEDFETIIKKMLKLKIKNECIRTATIEIYNDKITYARQMILAVRNIIDK